MGELVRKMAQYPGSLCARAFSLLFLAYFAGLPATATGAAFEIQVSKSQRLLVVKNGSRVEKQYRVASGKGGNGDKTKLGDHKTPVGIYRIVEFNDSEKFHRFLRLSYPNAKDAFFGLKNRIISRSDFDAIIEAGMEGRTPPQDTPLGGSIGIHGLGDETGDRVYLHLGNDWTEGCIAVTNEQIEELMHYVQIGTKVVISE